MLSNSTIADSTNTNNTTAVTNYNCTVSNSSVPCWPTLEPALNQLFPVADQLAIQSTLSSDDYLKLYTVVFEHCVGPVEGRKAGKSSVGAGLNISGEELYLTLVQYLQVRLTQWSNSLTEVLRIGYYECLFDLHL